jgi:hypothetical protein
MKKVYSAINRVTEELAREGITKSRNNAQQGYKFRGIDDVYNAIASVVSKHGLCILPRVLSREVTERATKNGGVMSYVVTDMEFDLVCAEDDSMHTIRVVGEAMDSADKATNKAMSAAMKYACLMAFQIPTEGDNDADATTPPVGPRVESAAPAPKVESTAAPGTAAHLPASGTYAADWFAAIAAADNLNTLSRIAKAVGKNPPADVLAAYNARKKALSPSSQAAE